MNQKVEALDLPDTPSCPRALTCASLPLIEELASTPDLWDVCRQLAHLPHLLFLDSAGGPQQLSRYSYITAQPFAWLSARRQQMWLNGESVAAVDPFAVLGEQLGRCRVDPVKDLPPFQGGAAGLFGYDLCHHLERLPRPRYDEFAVPDLAVGFFDWVVAIDHAKQRAWLVSTGLPETVPVRRQRRAAMRLQSVRQLLRKPPSNDDGFRSVSGNPTCQPVRACPLPNKPDVFSSFDRPGYLAAVRRAIEYIHAGDCYQVNLAQRLLMARSTRDRLKAPALAVRRTPRIRPSSPTCSLAQRIVRRTS
jgi:para-aminobenzoate synthetase component 1